MEGIREKGEIEEEISLTGRERERIEYLYSNNEFPIGYRTIYINA